MLTITATGHDAVESQSHGGELYRSSRTDGCIKGGLEFVRGAIAVHNVTAVSRPTLEE